MANFRLLPTLDVNFDKENLELVVGEKIILADHIQRHQKHNPQADSMAQGQIGQVRGAEQDNHQYGKDQVGQQGQYGIMHRFRWFTVGCKLLVHHIPLISAGASCTSDIFSWTHW